ncbi:MAG: hypothetical protein ABJ308_02765 [Halieaceae bacterium]
MSKSSPSNSPARLRQLNVSYMASEDRMLFKVSTSDDLEYRLWCTRRFTRLLLEQLQGMFAEEATADVAVPAAAREDVTKLKHSQSITEASFQQPYSAEPLEYPLGEQGLLMTTLRHKTLPDGAIALNLCGKENKGVTLNLDENLRHQLYELFSRAAERAKWFEPAALVTRAVVH